MRAYTCDNRYDDFSFPPFSFFLFQRIDHQFFRNCTKLGIRLSNLADISDKMSPT